MFSNILTTLLVFLIAFTSAWPTILTRDASADPVALPEPQNVITGKQVAILNTYANSTSTSITAGSKKCQTQAVNVKLEDGACYFLDPKDLGIKISSIVSGCKVYGYATDDCTGENQRITAGCFDVSSDTGSQLSSLWTVC